MPDTAATSETTQPASAPAPDASATDTSSMGSATGTSPGGASGLSGVEPQGASAESPETTAESLSANAWSIAAWNGELDSLPDALPEGAHYRDIVRQAVGRKSKSLDGDYTQKTQKLADDRRDFESGRGDLAARLEDAETNLAVYKALHNGQDDPRLAKLGEQLKSANKIATDLQKLVDDTNSQLDNQHAANQQRWLDGFKTKHKNILSDDTKQAELFADMEKGWAPEAAASLVGMTDQVKKRAHEIAVSNGLGGGVDDSEEETSRKHMLAVNYAKMELGVVKAARRPRPSAMLTAGAKGPTSAARTKGPIRGLPLSEGRLEAARRALKR